MQLFIYVVGIASMVTSLFLIYYFYNMNKSIKSIDDNYKHVTAEHLKKIDAIKERIYEPYIYCRNAKPDCICVAALPSKLDDCVGVFCDKECGPDITYI